MLGSTGSGKTTLRLFLTGNLTYRATQRTRVCEVRDTTIRFALNGEEKESAFDLMKAKGVSLDLSHARFNLHS